MEKEDDSLRTEVSKCAYVYCLRIQMTYLETKLSYLNQFSSSGIASQPVRTQHIYELQLNLPTFSTDEHIPKSTNLIPDL
jgi:hypothetical protein